MSSEKEFVNDLIDSDLYYIGDNLSDFGIELMWIEQTRTSASELLEQVTVSIVRINKELGHLHEVQQKVNDWLKQKEN